MYDALYSKLPNTRLKNWLPTLRDTVSCALDDSKNSDLPTWRSAVEKLAEFPKHPLHESGGVITIGDHLAITPEESSIIETALMTLHPWRKGPFSLHGIHLDTEWRSDFKWSRLQGSISSLKDRVVLDVGSGSGYHTWRMWLEGAKLAIGIDPVLKYVMQYQAIASLAEPCDAYVLPLRLEDIPKKVSGFDTIFSMGLLYHRKSPLDHLIDLRERLGSGGELVLETLVVEGPMGTVLVPEGRYAKMRNVWFIPTPETLRSWMYRTGFEDVKIVDVSATDVQEQRATQWMREESLSDFLDVSDHSKTIEGHPAPQRAILVGTKK